MTNFPNKFEIVGQLSEYQIEKKENEDYITATLAIQCGYDIITVKFFISEQYNTSQYEEFMSSIDLFQYNPYIYCSGNIVEVKEKLYFRGKFCRVVNEQNTTFEMQIYGIAFGKNKILNYINDEPVIFNIDYDYITSSNILCIELEYNPKFILDGDIVRHRSGRPLTISSISETEYYLDDEDIDKLLTEYEIMNMEK